jgi:hypothetical protein
MHTRLIDMVVRLPYCIQVPYPLWADDWHFNADGLRVFAESFAGSLVNHLREGGMAVEGFELRSRASACGARAVALGWSALMVGSGGGLVVWPPSVWPLSPSSYGQRHSGVV